MGWGSAGYGIFDPVTQALLDADASPRIITEVCTRLIRELTNEDWDTLDESISRFLDVPAVMAAFAAAAPSWLPEDYRPPAPPDDTGPTIRLVLSVAGETTIEVDRAEYGQAKTDGTVDHFLDVHLSAVETMGWVREPGGRCYNPAAYPHGPDDDGELEDAAAQDQDSEDPF